MRKKERKEWKRKKRNRIECTKIREEVLRDGEEGRYKEGGRRG